MKTKISHLGRSTVSVILAVMMFLSTMLIGTISVNAYDISSKSLYYANTLNWNTPKLQICSGDNYYNYDLTKIDNTNIYYRSDDWKGYTWFKFNDDKDYGAPEIGANVTSKTWYSGKSNVANTDFGKLNSTSKVVNMVSTDGNNYVEQSIGGTTVISGYNLPSDAVSATAVSSSTSSASSNASIEAAFGSTITYSANADSNYEFKGFSTTNSSSLPDNLNTNATMTQTSSAINGNSNDVYYAYYVAKNIQTPVAESVKLTASSATVTSGGSTTLTATLKNKATGVDKVTYTFKKADGTEVGTVKDSAENTASVNVDNITSDTTYTVTVSATDYSDVSDTAKVTVKQLENWYLIGSAFGGIWDTSYKQCKLDYDSATGFYYHNTTGAETGDVYFRFHDGNNQYCPDSDKKVIALAGEKLKITKSTNTYAFKYSNTVSNYRIWLDSSNASDIKVWITDITKKYNISNNSGKELTISPSQASAGETVTVKATPESGKVLKSVTVVGDDHTPVTTTVSGNTATFTMPDQNVTVTGVNFREAKTCKVTFSPSDATYGDVTAQYNGTAFATGNTVTEDDTVTFTANPNEGYTFTGWTVNDAPVSSTDNPYKITVNQNTDVVANFVTGTQSKYYLLCGVDQTFKAYKSVPLVEKGNGEYYADFDAAGITKDKDYYIIFSTKEDTSGIIDSSKNNDNAKVSVTKVENNNGFSFYDQYSPVSQTSGNTGSVKFSKVIIKSNSNVTGFTIKISGLDVDNKTITYSAEPKFDVAPADTVEITAKDGTIRAGFTDTDAGKTTAVLGDTTLSITTPDDEVITASDSYEIDGKNRAVTAKKVPNGSTVTVTTKINPEATFAGHKGSDYYVKGFSVNGIFGGVLSQTEGKSHSDNTYEYTFKVNQEIYNSQKLEITPVYFLKDDTNCVYFYIENYDSAKQVWGNTPSCYVYYANGASALAALGYYPGQPMVDYNGSIFTQIPKSIVNDGGTQKSITGMTLNNYVWDDVHRAYNNIEDPKAVNAQTYDYDDFVKIAESGAAADNIIYRFKYNKFDNKPQATLAASEADPAGWEVFLDYQNYPTDIFGNKIGNVKLDYKDTDSVKNNGDYLSIISNGYEKNYIGNYATSWSIYNKAGERVANIPSSALLYALGKDEAYMKTAINSDSIPDDFLPGKSNRESYWTEFKNLYTNYKDVPAQINFEASIKSGDDPGDRLDGRWYYSQSKETITGEIKIQYANTLDDYNTNNFHDDKFDDDKPTSIVGKTTGASAYFTDPKDKVRKLETEADNTQDYKFEVAATSTAAYTFVGWYRFIDGDYKAINPSDMSSLKGAVTRNSDVTLVARYIKTPGGSMTFNHSLYSGTNAGGGKATTEIQVVVTDSTGKSLYNSERIAGTASIDKDMITKLAVQTGLTVTVTLYTTTKNLYNFNGYYSAENTTDITAFPPSTADFTKTVSGDRKNGRVTESVYMFSFDDYYKTHKDTLIGENAGTVYYNFYSDITSIKVPYKVQFSYKDRMEKQKYYNRAGYVDPENTSSYTIVEDGNDVKVTLTDSFILSLAPYESNFTKNLTWDNPTDSKPFDSSISKSIASAVVNSTQSDRTIHLNVFRVSDGGDPTPLENKDGAFYLYKKDGSTELPYNSVFYKPNGDGTYIYDITAPKTYKDNGKELQFMYWAIYSDAECKNLVIKAYNIDGGFSYVSYDNYWIVPVYGASSTPSASVKEVSTSTQFMEVTRNQWTAADNNTFNGFDADDMTTLDTADDFIKGNDEDKLYADFVLNFFYNGKQLSVFDPNSKKVQTGIVMQKLALDEDSTGVGYITDMKHYADKYTKAELSAAAEDAKNKILKKETTIESLTKQIDNSRLSNKNRIQYYARFNNTEANANYVYRVYTYIKYVNESNETIIELGEPIYFTLYDVANKTV